MAGKSIDEILKLRHLKQGTVNDHFIEWALIDENFPFKSFELINFNELDKNQIVNARFQEYDSSYLTFRLSQIYRMREK
ncbi:MAG: helix-turn-helix domain-containing protein [Enterococcus raffinosus]